MTKEWVQLIPSGILPNQMWSCFDLSEDGAEMILVADAVPSGNLVYRSDNSGYTFSELTTPYDYEIYDMAFGTYSNRMIFGSRDEQKLFTTRYTGVPWVVISGISASYVSVDGAMSGRYYYAVGTSPVNVKKSTNYGVAFTDITLPNSSTDYSLAHITCGGSSGAYVFFTDYGVGLYKSTNSGGAWTQVTISGVANNWVDVACAPGLGDIVIALEEDDGLYKSTNYGVNWTHITISGASESTAWKLCDISNDGLKIAVVGNDTEDLVYVSTDGGTTWATETPPDWRENHATIRDIKVCYDGTKIIFGYCNTDTPDYNFMWMLDYVYVQARYDWRELFPSGEDHYYLKVALGREGCVAVSSEWYNGFISPDGGKTWREFSQGGEISSLELSDLAISYTTDYMVASSSLSENLFISSDLGYSWTTINPDSLGDWNAVALSNSGDKMYAFDGTGALYGSSDYGVSWQLLSSTVDASGFAQNLDCNSSSGQYLVMCTRSKAAWISSDYGDTVATPADLSAFVTWVDCSISSTGKYMAFLHETEGLYLSDDYGVTWVKNSLTLEDPDWDLFTHMDMSGDGQVIAVSVEKDPAGSLFVSYDGGVTWEDQLPIDVTPYKYISDIEISEDGVNIIFCYENSQVFYNGEEMGEPVTYPTHIKSIGRIPIEYILSVNGVTIANLKSIGRVSNEEFTA